MTKQTWRQWARAQMKDPTSPSELQKGSLASLTGQDAAILNAIVACWEVLPVSDADGRIAALNAVRVLLPQMLPHNRWLARELIPYAMNWEDRERLWPLVSPDRGLTPVAKAQVWG